MTPESKVKAWANEQYKRVFPNHWKVAPAAGPFGLIGCPDHLICWQGIFIAIELKANNGVVSDMQLVQLKSIIRAGGVAAVLRGKDLRKLYMIRDYALTKVKHDV
jgi:hypothetical protein